ncbi:MAG: hypothetical protein HQ472_07720 [Ignavibacteria bacterium]|nr:hypothetical protein [Ignavibacteria bacterium]
MKIALFIAIVLFLFFASLQFNDPDPIQWVLAYGSCAVLSALALYTKRIAMQAMVMSLLYFVWTIWLLLQTTGVWWDGEVERESGGLAICAVWCAIIFAHQKYFSK